MKLLYVLAAIFLGLTACQGSGGGSGASTPTIVPESLPSEPVVAAQPLSDDQIQTLKDFTAKQSILPDTDFLLDQKSGLSNNAQDIKNFSPEELDVLKQFRDNCHVRNAEDKGSHWSNELFNGSTMNQDHVSSAVGDNCPYVIQSETKTSIVISDSNWKGQGGGQMGNQLSYNMKAEVQSDDSENVVDTYIQSLTGMTSKSGSMKASSKIEMRDGQMKSVYVEISGSRTINMHLGQVVTLTVSGRFKSKGPQDQDLYVRIDGNILGVPVTFQFYDNGSDKKIYLNGQLKSKEEIKTLLGDISALDSLKTKIR